MNSAIEKLSRGYKAKVQAEHDDDDICAKLYRDTIVTSFEVPRQILCSQHDPAITAVQFVVMHAANQAYWYFLDRAQVDISVDDFVDKQAYDRKLGDFESVEGWVYALCISPTGEHPDGCVGYLGVTQRTLRARLDEHIEQLWWPSWNRLIALHVGNRTDRLLMEALITYSSDCPSSKVQPRRSADELLITNPFPNQRF